MDVVCSCHQVCCFLLDSNNIFHDSTFCLGIHGQHCELKRVGDISPLVRSAATFSLL